VLVDTHTHIHDPAFDEDRDAVVERARAAGVTDAVTVGCTLEDSARALASAQRYGLHASVGIHPHEAKDAPPDLEAAFAPLLDRPQVVAVGETGLDYYYDHSPRAAQADVLRAHLSIAKKWRKPVIFHHRDAFDDFCAVLRTHWTADMRGVVHCFTGDADQARVYVEEFGLYLGIGGVVTFKTAEALRQAVAWAGLERLVLETDAPYLAPVPYRGRRNEPAFTTATADRVAEIFGVSRERVDEVTTHNARELFTLSP